MYYEEKIINGVLCHRSSPKGTFKPFTDEQLTEKIVKLEQEVRSLENQLEDHIQQG